MCSRAWVPQLSAAHGSYDQNMPLSEPVTVVPGICKTCVRQLIRLHLSTGQGTHSEQTYRSIYVTASCAVNHPCRTNRHLSHRSRTSSLGCDRPETETSPLAETTVWVLSRSLAWEDGDSSTPGRAASKSTSNASLGRAKTVDITRPERDGLSWASESVT